MKKENLEKIKTDICINICNEYFENNKKKLKQLELTKKDVIEYYEDFLLSLLIGFNEEIKNDSLGAIGTISLCLSCAFEPSKNYLKRVVEVLKSFQNNQDVLNILFGYDPAEMYGASAHTSICNKLICDSNFCETLHGNTYPLFRKGFCNYTDTHFYGFIPYVFFNFLKQQYNDLLNFAVSIIKKIPDKTLALLFNLYHFTKEFDKENYETFVELMKEKEGLFNSYKITFLEGFGIAAGDLKYESKNLLIKDYL